MYVIATSETPMEVMNDESVFKGVEEMQTFARRGGQHDQRRSAKKYACLRHVTGYLIAPGDRLVQLGTFKWRRGSEGAFVGSEHLAQHLRALWMPIVYESIGKPSGHPLKFAHEPIAPRLGHYFNYIRRPT